MAERAVLARKRGDGRYMLLSARWGGTNRMLAAVFDGTPPDVLPDITWNLRQQSVSFPALVTTLDYLSTAALYRVDQSGISVFLPLWFGLPLPDETAARSAGALVAVDSLPEVRAFRAHWRSLKGALTDALVAGQLPASAAPFVLAGWVRGLADRERYVSPFSASEH